MAKSTTNKHYESIMGYYPVFQAIRLGRVRSGTGSWFKWKRKANNNRRKVRSKEWVRFWFEPRKHFCPSAWRCWAPLWTTTTYHVDPTRDGCSAGLKRDWHCFNHFEPVVVFIGTKSSDKRRFGCGKQIRGTHTPTVAQEWYRQHHSFESPIWSCK